MKCFTIVITVTLKDGVAYYNGTASFFYQEEGGSYLTGYTFEDEGENQKTVHDSLVQQAISSYNNLT